MNGRTFCRKLKEKIGLDECRSFSTSKTAARKGVDLPQGKIAFYLRKGEISHVVYADKKIFQQSPYADTDYYLKLVTKYWLEHLKKFMAEMLWQELRPN